MITPVGNIFFGMVAIILPLISIFGNKNRSYLFSLISLSACSISAFLLLWEVENRVIKLDWSYLIDLATAMRALTFLLTFLTIILNLIAFYTYKKK